MQKSIFKKYFRICATLITVCIVVLGVVLMLFSFQYVKSEKYELLESSVKKADTMTEALAYDDLSTAASNVYLQSYCEVLSSAVDSSLFLVDLDGRVLYCTETKPCTHTDQVLSVSLLNPFWKVRIIRIGKWGFWRYLFGSSLYGRETHPDRG